MNNKKHVECINKVRQEIKDADETVGYIKFELAGSNGITGQRIIVEKKGKKRDGTPSIKISKEWVAHDYCPFCGEKYV